MLMCACSVTSIVSNSATPWTVACQDSLSIGLSRQDYWSGLPCPPPGDLLNPGIEPLSLTSSALAGRFFTTSATWEAQEIMYREKSNCPQTTSRARRPHAINNHSSYIYLALAMYQAPG